MLNGIKSMYVLRVKGSESDCFSINSGVRQGCIKFPWLFNIYMDSDEVKIGMGRRIEHGDCLASCI